MEGIEAIYGLVGVVVGFLASFAVFRARFVSIEKDVEKLREDFKREIEYLRQQAADEWRRIRDDVRQACRGDDEFQRRTERREREMILILASIARKLGAGNRLTDLATYTEENEEMHIDKP